VKKVGLNEWIIGLLTARCCRCVAELTSIQSKIFELGTTLEQIGAMSRTAVGGSCLNVTEVELYPLNQQF